MGCLKADISIRPLAEVVYDFEAIYSNQISLCAGDKIVILNEGNEPINVCFTKDLHIIIIFKLQQNTIKHKLFLRRFRILDWRSEEWKKGNLSLEKHPKDFL